MNKILLVSEDTLKSYSTLNDNFFGKNILPCIKTTQDIELKQILGSCLLESLCAKVDDSSIKNIENTAYKTLLDEYVQPFMIYMTLAHIVTETSTKLSNFGTMVSNDEHLENVSLEERSLVKQQYEYYADNYCKQMQSFLKANKEAYPELECGCNCSDETKPNLDSAASTSLWLGGYRGKIIMDNNCCK